MSKFFTILPGLLLASLGGALASEPMPTTVPAVPGSENSLAPAGEGTGLPTSLVLGRFAALGKKSPFTLASATEENADFAKDLTLAGYVRMDGQDFVMVANRNRPDRLMVGTKASPAAQGLVLVKVERDPSGDPTKLRAQIRKGTETATLRYESSASAPAQPPAGQAALPGQPAVAPGTPPGLGAPGQKAPPTAPVIRRRNVPITPTPAQ